MGLYVWWGRISFLFDFFYLHQGCSPRKRSGWTPYEVGERQTPPRWQTYMKLHNGSFHTKKLVEYVYLRPRPTTSLTVTKSDSIETTTQRHCEFEESLHWPNATITILISVIAGFSLRLVIGPTDNRLTPWPFCRECVYTEPVIALSCWQSHSMAIASKSD